MTDLQALSAYFYREVVLWRYQVGKARCIGEVTEVFERRRAFIVPLMQGQFVNLLESVHLIGRWSCVEATIESIHVNNNANSGIGAFDGAVEVGMVASILPKRNTTIYANV